MEYLIAFIIGVAIGVVLTIFLLSPKNLRMYHKLSDNVTDNVSRNYALAKAVYNSEIYGDEKTENNEEEKEGESEDDEL